MTIGYKYLVHRELMLQNRMIQGETCSEHYLVPCHALSWETPPTSIIDEYAGESKLATREWDTVLRQIMGVSAHSLER